MSTQDIIDCWNNGVEPYNSTKFWRKEALRWLKRFRKTNHYSDWENYRSAKALSS